MGRESDFEQYQGSASRTGVIEEPASSLNAGIETRFVVADDIGRLMRLEHRKWTAEQAARPEDLAGRIAAYPEFCIGSFCRRTGEALASLFARPLTAEHIRAAATWRECATAAPSTPARSRTLFGISLTSVDPAAMEAMLRFFWPVAIKAGVREIYLGSPLPGLRAWRRTNPHAPVEEYARARRKGRPIDPQLYYYYEKGFRHLEAVRPDYFPHALSLDYGAVVRAPLPLSAAGPLLRILPLSWLRRLALLALSASQQPGRSGGQA